MKRETKSALGIGGIVIVAAAVGLGLFLFTSSQLGVGFIAIGIPTLLVVGVGVYVRSVVSRQGTSESNYTKQQATETATDLRDFHAEFEALHGEYPDWNADDVETDVERVADDLEEQGVSFDTAAGTYSTKRFGSADIQDLERIQSDVRDLDSTLTDSFEEFVRSELRRLRDTLGRLETADLADVRSWRGQQAVDDAGHEVDELEDVLADHRADATDVVERASEEVETLLADVDGRVDDARVRDLLEDARSRAEADDHDGAVDTVLDAQAALEGDLSGRFEADRESVENLLEAVQSSVVEEYVSARHVERVEEIDAAMASLDSALDVSDLREHRDDLREVSVEMVAEMEGDLEDDLSALGRADVPADYYEWPSAGDEEYEAQLRRTDDLDQFRLTWTGAVGDLSNALDDLSEKASVARSYDDIESVIEQEIRASAEVAADDLPVKDAGAFMELYARKHAEVSYDPSGPALVAAGDGETHDVTVFAQFEEGGPKRGVAIEIEGTAHDDSEHRRTHLAEEVTFEEVPFGEYEVRAVPDPDDYRTPEETVTVEDDARVELTMNEVGLREQVCEGVEADIREYLPDLEDDLTDQYDDEGYLAASMDYPITDDYVPCLLALWAEEADLSVTRTDADGVVAYDGEQLDQEVEMVVQHNLGENETMTFDDFRTRFLSAPLPDDVIRGAIADAEFGESVELTADGVTKRA
ncbi:hypothetical protein M0R88_09375 [Halorussus gelatinilyticus]|uniref:Coiled-coil protein n=1 Tax=Halorussus gelatinilyticus TaxID=2937524 RepID=A0A8U0IM93_9EURY|nr:hypothetical protein [Halorussus gelatinilyticus]UPW02283.1 hypothetical protein M0R88_09375 [Halorussus gelatinilyticus]